MKAVEHDLPNRFIKNMMKLSDVDLNTIESLAKILAKKGGRPASSNKKKKASKKKSSKKKAGKKKASKKKAGKKKASKKKSSKKKGLSNLFG